MLLQRTLYLFVSLLPFTALASHDLLKITATTPFPEHVAATTASIATFTVKNVAHTPLTPVDVSRFSHDSGLSIESTTCNAPLAPGESCTVEVKLNAAWQYDEIDSALRFWAKPSKKIVQYPIHVDVTHSVPQITLKLVETPIFKPELPGFREPIVAEHAGKWMLLSGSNGQFHDFEDDFNTDIFVYDPLTHKMTSVVIAESNLPKEVKKQLASSVPVHLQDHNTMYIIGGYYNDKNDDSYTTLNTVTAIDVKGMMHAVLAGDTNLKPYVAYCSENTKPCPAHFKVTGGQLGKLDEYLYLTFGHDCEGFYCSTSQTYSNAIYKFTAKPNYKHNTLLINNIAKVVHADDDGSGWRRRDYSLAPFKWHGAQALLAMAGPFTPDDNAMVWTNAIIFDKNLHYNSQFMSQQGNQYANAHVSMYSEKTNTSYVATFASLSNLYWSVDGLKYDPTTPAGNILDLISATPYGDIREYVNLKPMCSGEPLDNCLYMGIGAEFIPADHSYDKTGMLNLDKLPPEGKTLVGYIYGGLISYNQEPFSAPQETFVTNKVYEVYVEPNPHGKVHWQNVTNAFTSF
jgi:hypothetical protein